MHPHLISGSFVYQFSSWKVLLSICIWINLAPEMVFGRQCRRLWWFSKPLPSSTSSWQLVKNAACWALSPAPQGHKAQGQGRPSWLSQSSWQLRAWVWGHLCKGWGSWASLGTFGALGAWEKQTNLIDLGRARDSAFLTSQCWWLLLAWNYPGGVALSACAQCPVPAVVQPRHVT